MDALAVVGLFFAAVAAGSGVVAAMVAWKALRAGLDTTAELGKIAEQLRTATAHMQATAEAVERSRQEDLLAERRDRYERVSAGVQTIRLARMLGEEDRENRVTEAQASMRAALAVIPDVTGAAGSYLEKCWKLSRGTQVSVSDAEIEIDGAIRELEEQLRALRVPTAGPATHDHRA